MYKPIAQKPAAKPKYPRKEKPKWTKIALYIVTLIIISAIFSFTFMLFYYVNAITEYEVENPNTGLMEKGVCLEEHCKDMKDYAISEVQPKILKTIYYGAGIAALVVLLHYLVPFKNLFIWIINIAYLVFLGIIANMWIIFNQMK